MNAEVTALFEVANRTCRRCRTARPTTDFHLCGNGERRRNICAQCRSEADLRERHGRRSPENRLREKLRGQYGITLEQYQEMLETQNGLCAMCGTEPSGKRRLVVDHCHESGRVRALLCNPCNTGLGAYEKLRSQAAVYLAQYGAGNPLLNYDAAEPESSAA